MFIQENDQYVTIKGTLDLNGEYRNIQRTGESEPKDYTQEFYPRHVQSVRPAANDCLEFSHRFPVDITVPYNRIESTDDIDVTIQSFDYNMLEKNCLKLQAELLVGGVYLEAKPPAAEEAERKEEEVSELQYEQPEPELLYRSEPEPDYALEPLYRTGGEPETDTEQELYQTFTAEARKQPEDEEETEPRLDYQDAVQIPVVAYPDDQEEKEEPTGEAEVQEPVFARPQEAITEIEQNREPEPAYRSAKLEERPPETAQPSAEREAEEAAVRAEADREAEEAAVRAEANREAEEAAVRAEADREAEEAAVRAEADREAEEAAVRAEANRKAEEAARTEANRQVKIAELADKAPKPRVKPAQSEGKEEVTEKKERRVSLMDFLGRKQEEELVKMKVCIVQQGDTAATVADRYEVSLQTLLYSNSLDPAQDLYEGQVLYIPRTTAYKS